MKRNLLAVITAMVIVFGLHGMAWALPNATGPHADYRSGNPGYATGCDGNAACHVITQGSFLPQTLDNTAGYTPINENYTNFCLACHNASGEAHEKSVGTPSNNTYINMTGLVQGTKGVSHNWKGIIGNAGTRVPFLNRTAYMPHRVVACQTCHNAPIQNANEWIDWLQATNPSNDQLNYTILGYTSTPQYLNQYLKVYRSAVALSKPTYRRDRKQYTVSPTEYTYNNSNATITFNTAQGTNNIYVELAEPYLRGSNAGNALCIDCHNNRVDSSVSHPSGSGAKNNHPVSINYGYNFGLHSTLKPAPTGNAYLENGQVLCTSCHDPHNAASDNGQILREKDGYTLCADCHKTKLSGYSTAGSVNIHYGTEHINNNEPPTVCTDCHGHNSNNVLLIKDVINGKAVNFQSFTGARSFGPDTGFGICEVCHTKTAHHLSDNSPSGQGHNTGLNCTQCHKHENGFQPPVGGAGSCTACHGQPPAPGATPTSYGWADNTGNKHTAHMTYIQNKFGLTGTSACACCHGNRPLGTHPENRDTAYIDPSNSYWQGQWGTAVFSDNSTIGKISTSDDSCTNVGCHLTAGTRYWNDMAAQCDSCHEYPNSARDWDMTAKVNGHTVRASTLQNVTSAISRTSLKHLNVATFYNVSSDTYDSVTKDVNKCGKCHPNVLTNHQNNTINVVPNGFAACGGGSFTFNNITSRKVVTCSNVECHVSKTTPNWY